MKETLSRRETQVLKLLLSGYLQKDIGHLLHLSESRVQDIKATIKRKWGVSSEIEFILEAVRRGFLELEQDGFGMLHSKEFVVKSVTQPYNIHYNYLRSEKRKVQVIVE